MEHSGEDDYHGSEEVGDSEDDSNCAIQHQLLEGDEEEYSGSESNSAIQRLILGDAAARSDSDEELDMGAMTSAGHAAATFRALLAD